MIVLLRACLTKLQLGNAAIRQVVFEQHMERGDDPGLISHKLDVFELLASVVVQDDLQTPIRRLHEVHVRPTDNGCR